LSSRHTGLKALTKSRSQASRRSIRRWQWVFTRAARSPLSIRSTPSMRSAMQRRGSRANWTFPFSTRRTWFADPRPDVAHPARCATSGASRFAATGTCSRRPSECNVEANGASIIRLGELAYADAIRRNADG